MVRPGRRPRIARRGSRIPQGRQRSLGASGDCRQGMEINRVNKKKKQTWFAFFHEHRDDDWKEGEARGVVNYSPPGISYARSVTQPRLWCMSQREPLSLSLSHATSIQEYRDIYRLSRVWWVEQQNLTPPALLSSPRHRRNAIDARVRESVSASSQSTMLVGHFEAKEQPVILHFLKTSLASGGRLDVPLTFC